jgi:Holliday junction resolvase RusA-like endonuclease
MNNLFELELEGLPPTVNTMYRSVSGRRYKRADAKSYQERVSCEMRRLWSGAPYDGRAELRIEFTTKDKRRWDIDNRVKALQDCLVLSGVLADDTLIDTLHVERRKGDTTSTRLVVNPLEE